LGICELKNWNHSVVLLSHVCRRSSVSIPLISGYLLSTLVKLPVVVDAGCELLPRRPPVEPPPKRPPVVADAGLESLTKGLTVVTDDFETPPQILFVVADAGFEPPPKELPVVSDAGFEPLPNELPVLGNAGFEKRLSVVVDAGFGLLAKELPVAANTGLETGLSVVVDAGCELLLKRLPPPFCAGVLKRLWPNPRPNPESGRWLVAATSIGVPSGLVPVVVVVVVVVVGFPSPPNRLLVVGVAWLDDPKELDSVDFFWFNVAKILTAGALDPATGPFGVFGLEVVEVGIVLFEPEVGNRPLELAVRNELLELTVSFSGVADADREDNGVADTDLVCSGVADADRVGGGVPGTQVNMPAKWPGCFGLELSETALVMSVDLECRVVRLPALTS
jgi:hypothetical protein